MFVIIQTICTKFIKLAQALQLSDSFQSHSRSTFVAGRQSARKLENDDQRRRRLQIETQYLSVQSEKLQRTLILWTSTLRGEWWCGGVMGWNWMQQCWIMAVFASFGNDDSLGCAAAGECTTQNYRSFCMGGDQNECGDWRRRRCQLTCGVELEVFWGNLWIFLLLEIIIENDGR